METKNSQPVTAGGAGAEPPSLASAPKSLADIMAEMRRGTKLPGYWSSSALNKILAYHADRIEAAAKRESSGNTAAMREALEAARDLLLPQCNGGTAFAKACGKTVNKIMDALSAPPRNCDVGTIEEQTQRFMAICESVKPAEPHYSETGEVLCPSIGSGQECKLGICTFGQCALKWAQMPYEEGETK